MKLNAEQEKLLAIFFVIPPMHPCDLFNSFPLTREDLSQICHVSDSTVNHWFSAGSKRPPKKQHKKICGIVHFLLSNQKELLPILEKLKKIQLR